MQINKLIKLLEALEEAAEWSLKINENGETNWEATNKCGRAKDKVRTIIESILADIET